MLKTHTFQINAGESCTIDISGNCGTIIEGPAVLVMIKDDRNIAPKVEVNIKSCEASSLVEVIKEEIGECIKNRKVVW
ncbi:hypothetical protein M5X04_14535 [Paenibacillus alvei]|uniref:Uncharacterized protein n=1 Tax=Paenibacillus alvei TaxID=44250 RepID=A0ABT4E9W9_PAEAL|nr:hypothetical protein [Paenibacillus alvei]MCY9530536.1 hypothetical protein [Paenibacillus alvei]